MRFRPRFPVRSGAAGIALLVAVTGVHAQVDRSAPAVDSAALRARITTLPSRPVELKKIDRAVPDAVREDRTGTAAARLPGGPVPARPAPAEAWKGAPTARYVPLPAPEHAATNAVLSGQLAGVKSAHPGVPSFVAFKGALITRTNDASEVTLIPLVVIDDPLRFEPTKRLFEGSIAVGLVELGVKGPPKPLPAAVTFQTLGPVTAAPDLAEVKSTAPPFRRIVIAARDPRDKVELQVFSTGMEPVLVAVPVERARLQITAKPKLQGWGLESTEVTVSASDGAASRGEEVVLTPPAFGTLSATTVRLGDNGSGTTRLRSESTGTVELAARSFTLGPPEPLKVEYEFPIRFLLSGLAGGLAGAVLKRGARRAGARRWARDLLLGVLTGAVVLGLFVFGVNVTGFPLPSTGGEVLVFVVAALGGFMGTQLLQPKSPASGRP